MTIAVLIPTIEGREKFLKQALNLISEQTVQPTFIEIVDYKPVSPGIDVALRYKVGIERCQMKNADVIIFWEDDDWYKYNYIELLLKNWVLCGQPDIFGLSKTIYYNIVKRKYLLIDHPGRASMMSTMITKNVIPNWEDSHNQFVDLELWKNSTSTKGTMDNPFDKPIAIGIKHGIGLTAGGGHKWGDDKFPFSDLDLTFLSSIIDKDSLNFYATFYPKTHEYIGNYSSL